MKLFQCTQKFFRMLGLHPPQHCQNSPFNLKNTVIILLLVVGFLDAIAFLLFQAKSVKEFGDSFYVSASCCGTLVYFSIHVRKMTNVSKLIERFEGLLQKSKFQWFWFYASCMGFSAVSIWVQPLELGSNGIGIWVRPLPSAFSLNLRPAHFETWQWLERGHHNHNFPNLISYRIARSRFNRNF